MIRNNILLTIVLFVLLQPVTAQENIRSVFYTSSGRNHQWITSRDNHRSLYRIIFNEAFELLEKRSEHIDGLSSGDEWKNYQQKAKANLCSSLDKFEKTPLNPRVTGKLERETFTVEKILFESHPDFYVTACMFLPEKRETPAPAVIYCSGHTELGFRSDTYQRVIINLVNKGFIVFAFDPIGQGERLQYADPETNQSRIGGSTKEHSYAGIQTLLTGTSLTDYFIWDGIRALDYLETREEVDMKRVGITGRSGGGTQSSMIAACDDRIYAAAPECYITNFKRLLQSIGPQDAEQNPYNAIIKGFDHPDFLHIRAPKPTLIVTTTHDFFSIQGARETFEEVKRSYTALGKPGNILMVEDLGVHESTKNNREAVYAFFQNHLKLPGNSRDVDIEPFTVEELWVTSTGQVETSLKGETVFDLNKKYYAGKKFKKNKIKDIVTETAGIDLGRKLSSAVYTGKFFPGEETEVERYFLENDRNDFALPVYVIKREKGNPGNKLVVWLHPGGKEKILQQPMLKELLNSGYTIISSDMPGSGELRDPDFSGDGIIKGVPFNYTFGAHLVGKSVTGIKAEAIDLLMQFIKNDKRFQRYEVNAIAQSTTAAEILHYAVISKNLNKIVLSDAPETGMELLETEYYDPVQAYSKVPGSLNHYDMPDLISCLPADKVKTCYTTVTDKDDQYTNKIRNEIIGFLE